MTPANSITDLEFELVARWEDENARGNCVSIEAVCADHPEVLPRARLIVHALAQVARILSPKRRSGAAPGGTADYPDDWEEIGSGASSVVYRGQDPTFDTAVAFKVLHTQNRLLTSQDALRLMQRFELEAQILGRLKHDGIVRVYKTFELAGRPVLEMEYLPGGTLVTRVEEVRARGATGIARFFERIARAVGHAHAHGIVHRDLKPSNILLDKTGRPCVSDFGVAKLVNADKRAEPVNEPGGETAQGLADLTVHGRQPGTYAYMAPEQFDPSFGEIKPATDVWAMGVVLHELLYGVRPFLGDTRNEMRDLVCRPTPFPHRGGFGLKGRLNRIISRCLVQDQGRRFESARQLADALEKALLPRRWWLAIPIVLATALVVNAVWWRPAPTPPTNTKPEPVPEWSDHPTVQDAYHKLAKGEAAVLIDGEQPAAFHWPRGSETGKIIRSDEGRFGLHSVSPGGALMELLPHLPPGSYRIDAELKHETGNGFTWVGVYAAASHWTTNQGRVHNFVMAKYTDLGPHASEGSPPGGIMQGRRTHQMARFLAESDRHPFTSIQLCPDHPGGKLVLPPPRGWRTVSLIVTSERVRAMQQGTESVGEVSADDLNALSRDALRRQPAIGMPPPFRTHGGIGLYVYCASVLVNRFQVTPLDSPK